MIWKRAKDRERERERQTDRHIKSFVLTVERERINEKQKENVGYGAYLSQREYVCVYVFNMVMGFSITVFLLS